MKQKIYKYSCKALLTSAIAISGACTDLDETLYDVVPMDQYGTTEAEIATITGAAYASLRGFADGDAGVTAYPTSEFVMFADEVPTDEACIPTRGTDWYDNGVYIDLHQHTFKADNKCFNGYWRYCYNGITSVNSVIYQIEQAGMTDDKSAPILAELRTLRAYYYWLLVNSFGDVPIVTDFTATELPAKSSRTDVFAFIEKEIVESIPDLSSNKSYGRMTAPVAYALLARLYLNAEVYTGKARWQDCLDACDMVNGYSLEADYAANFKISSVSSDEIILAVPYDHAQGTVGNYMQSMSLHYQQWRVWDVTQPGGGWSANGFAAVPGVYSSFDESDVRRESLMIGEQRRKDNGSIIITDNGNQLIYTENIDKLNNSDGAAAECQGARMFKYEQDNSSWERDNDLVLMRYAEILMMKAECYWRLGYANTGLPFINEIRQRAGLANVTELTEELLDNEYLHEFLFEGIRRTQQIRFGTYFGTWWEHEPSSLDASGASALFPIPESILALNPNLSQNNAY